MDNIKSAHLFDHGDYAILKHTFAGKFHYDLILEGEPLCPTYQSLDFELSNLIRIKDHRKKYLSFEGEISPEKGCVEIKENGHYELSKQGLTLILIDGTSKSLSLP